MNEEDRLQRESSRGDRAKELLENELLIEAKQKILDNIQDKWANTPVRDVQAREFLYMQQKSITEVFRHLQSVLETGKMAKQTLLEKMKQWNMKRN